MSCREEKKRLSSLPPRCYHRKPSPFYCPTDGCLPPQPKLPARCRSPPTCPRLICRPRPAPSLPPPAICIAARCPQPSYPTPYRPATPKISPPPSCVRFCIRYTDDESRYYPYYTSSLPKCPSNIC